MTTAAATAELTGLPEVNGVEHRMVDLGELRVHVAEAGEGEPLLLLHGWPQHWYMWHRVIPSLAERFRLIIPDLRGFGWSDAPASGYDPETFAGDQIALLDAMGIERVKVAGHDWGGFTTFMLGIEHSERVERILVLNSPHPWVRPSTRLLPEIWRSWYTWAMAAPGIGVRFAERRIPRIVLSRGNVGTPFPESELEIYLSRLRSPERADATTALYRNYQRLFARAARSPKAFGRLKVPGLLLFGAQDRWVTPKLVERPAPGAEKLEIELVPDSGHFIVAEKPDLVADRALELFS